MKQPILGLFTGTFIGFLVALMSGANPWAELSVERHTARFVTIVVGAAISGGLLGRLANRAVPRFVSVPLTVFFLLLLIPGPHPKAGISPFGIVFLVDRMVGSPNPSTPEIVTVLSLTVLVLAVLTTCLSIILIRSVRWLDAAIPPDPTVPPAESGNSINCTLDSASSQSSIKNSNH